MSVKRLTTKQFNFCLEYVKQPNNATQAAIAAGYSVKTAAGIAHENLIKPQITQKIEELRKKADEAVIMTRGERVKVLSEIGRAAVTEFVDAKGNIDLAGGQPGVISEVTVKDWRYGKAGKESQLSSRTKKVKLYDKLQAIDILNRMEKIYSEGLAVNIDNRKVEILVTGEPVKTLLSEVIDGVTPHEEENV